MYHMSLSTPNYGFHKSYELIFPSVIHNYVYICKPCTLKCVCVGKQTELMEFT